MKTAPELAPSAENAERTWLPMVVAAAVVLLIAVVAIVGLEYRKKQSSVAIVTPISAPLDNYAASLPVSGLVMSEAGNLAGGKVTYVDGHIANRGPQTVTGVTVQVLFRNYAHEVAQNETKPLKLIRIRDPYIDIEPVSAAPLKPGDEHDFRLIFDAVTPNWDGAYPEIRVVRVEAR